MEPLNLKGMRMRAGLSRSQLARIIGVSQPTVSNWELGVRRIPRKRIVEIMSACDAAVSDVDGPPPPCVHRREKTDRYDDSVREKACAMRMDGESIRSIAETLKVSPGSVHRWTGQKVAPIV